VRTSIDEHQTIDILRFCFFTECLNEEAVVPHCLKDVNSTGFHGRSRLGREPAGDFLDFAALLAERARSGQHHKGFVIAVFEKIAFHRNEQIKKMQILFSPVFGSGSFPMKEYGPTIGIKDCSCLLRGWRLRRAPISPSIGAAV